MKLILIRHGESARNRGYEVLGEENNLTVVGVKQAVEVGAELAPKKISAIYCSQTPRCEQTMDEILRIRDDSFPIHFSRLLGPKMKSENYEKLKARVELFLDDLKYDHSEEDIVVVISHQMTISMALFLIEGKQEKLANGEIREIMFGN
jgi:broad specificity phosphatase PhoE